MSSEVYVVVLFFHLLAMLFMAAPLYMLVIVNERARFAVPAGYNTDRYMENIIKNQPVRCYAYLGVIVVTGILLTWNKGLWTHWALIIKLVVTAILFFLLSYVHKGIQPQIEAILSKVKPGEEVPAHPNRHAVSPPGKERRPGYKDNHQPGRVAQGDSQPHNQGGQH